MLRIDVQGGGSTVRVAGRLTGPWVDELVHVLDGLSTNGSVVVDLTDVSFADAAGVGALRALRRCKSVRLRCSAFVAAQLA